MALSRTGNSPVLLPDDVGTQIVGSLPESFQHSCTDMVASWGEGPNGTAHWSVRVLWSERDGGELRGVLALRCWSTFMADPNVGSDERPAIVTLTSDVATLDLVPLAKDCDDCLTLYRLESPGILAVTGARLVELRVHYSDYNRCCDGGDHESGDRVILLVLSDGKRVLTVDERSEKSDHVNDVENGESDFVTTCKTKTAYVRNQMGQVERLSTETRCTENDRPVGRVKRASFRWNPGSRLFEDMKQKAR